MGGPRLGQTIDVSFSDASFSENSTSASAFQSSCDALGGFYCSQGAEMQLNFTSNYTKLDYVLTGYVVRDG